MAKISEKQRNCLIDLIKRDKNLVSGKFNNSFTHKDAEARWIEISSTLNSIPGSSKPWKSWRKTWQDMRSRTKTKYSNNKRNLMGTGGGPYVEDVVSTADEEIMAIIKPVCLNGHEEVQESNVPEICDTNVQPQIIVIQQGTISPEPNTQIDRATVINNQKQHETLDPGPTTTTSNKKTEAPMKRTLAKRGGIKLRRTERAASQYESMLERKLDIKEKYYKKKLELMQEKNNILKAAATSLNQITGLIENFF